MVTKMSGIDRRRKHVLAKNCVNKIIKAEFEIAIENFLKIGDTNLNTATDSQNPGPFINHIITGIFIEMLQNAIRINFINALVIERKWLGNVMKQIRRKFPDRIYVDPSGKLVVSAAEIESKN